MADVVGIVNIENGRLLLVQSMEGTWILPGGKREDGESSLEALYRELSEELPETEIDIIDTDPLEENGDTPHTKRFVRVCAYYGKVKGDITPGAEIVDSGRFTLEEIDLMNVSEITKSFIKQAIQEGRF